MDFENGQIVISRSGRDKGKMMVVTGCENGFVLVCDGKERPLERAKRKNPRHLEKTSMFIDKDSMTANSKLRKKLRFLDNQGG